VRQVDRVYRGPFGGASKGILPRVMKGTPHSPSGMRSPAQSSFFWLVGLATAASAQSPPAPRSLGPVVARAAMTFGPIGSIEVVRGSVFVNDMGSRQLLLLDSTLTRSRVVLDSSLSRDNSYGRIAEKWGLRRFRGDSVFMVPNRAGSMLVIGPTGTLARIAAEPSVADFFCVYLSMDDRGRLTCQVPTGPAFRAERTALMRTGAAAAGSIVRSADSSVVVGVHIDTRRVDTLASVVVAVDRDRLETGGRGLTIRPVLAPSWPGDQWATLRDGTIAIARVTDYRVDFIAPDGTRLNGPRVPYAWRRFTEFDRRALSDSLVRAESLRVVTNNRRYDSVRAAGGRIGVPNTAWSTPPLLADDEWPSFWPPIVPGTLVADQDNHVWIQEAQPPGGDTVKVFTVIDRRGALVDRVKVPDTYFLQGFGPGGAVYFTTLDAGRSSLFRMKWTR
jgi:hypothetical protein